MLPFSDAALPSVILVPEERVPSPVQTALDNHYWPVARVARAHVAGENTLHYTEWKSSVHYFTLCLRNEWKSAADSGALSGSRENFLDKKKENRQPHLSGVIDLIKIPGNCESVLRPCLAGLRERL